MKKTFSILLVLLLVWSAMPDLVRAETVEEGADSERIAHLHQRMASVSAQYPAGSYFTDNGRACTHHYNCRSFGNCNCKEVGEMEAGTPGNYQCFGFARFVFYQLFGLAFPHYNASSPWKVAESEECENITTLYSQSGGTILTEAEMKTLLSRCAFGDVIQVGAPHTMVVVGMDEEGIEVYDSNFDLVTCKVQVHHITWKRMCQYLSRGGMSIYRCAEYPQWKDEAVLKCTALPKEPITVEGKNLAGLVFEYTKRDTHYILTCDESGIFTCFDGVTYVPITDPEAYGLSLSLIPGERFDSGTLRFSFLDAVCEKKEEILLSSEGILEFSPPSKTTYFLGEELSVADVYIYLQHPEKGRVFCTAKDLVFTGFDSSRAGNVTVTVSAMGYETTFQATVLPRPAAGKTPAKTEQAADTGHISAAVWAVWLLFGAVAGVLLWRITRKRKTEAVKKR